MVSFLPVYQKCSVSCGTGIQVRKIECVLPISASSTIATISMATMNGQGSGVDYINDDSVGSTTYFDNSGGSYSSGNGYGITNMSRTNILNNFQCDPKMKPPATQKCTTGIDCAPSKINGDDDDGRGNSSGGSSSEENIENTSKSDSTVSVEQPEKTDGVQEYEDGEVEDDDDEDDNEEDKENDKAVENPTETRTGEIIRGINTETGNPVSNGDVSFESYVDGSSEEAKQAEGDTEVSTVLNTFRFYYFHHKNCSKPTFLIL